jgi:glycosyltransferase involved in cell wall biosynthesis
VRGVHSGVSGETRICAGAKRLCIISPMHPCLNPRVVKEADALAEAGFSVSVVAPRYLTWADEADLALGVGKWQRAAAPAFGPIAPFGDRIRELAERSGLALALRIGLRSAAVLHSALHPATSALARAARAVDADLYIGHYPAGLAAAAVAAQRRCAAYAFDAEDYHLGDLPSQPKFERARSVVRAVEARYLAKAAYVSAAAPLIADAYAKAYGITRPTVVLNTFPRAQAAPAPLPRDPTQVRRPSLYWFSQTIGPDRGLECALEAIALSHSQPRLVLRGEPRVNFVARLLERAEVLGISDLLEILPRAAPHEMERLAAQHDAGFSGETGHTENRRIMLTNKQFSYMLAGLPTILSDIPSHRAFAAEAKAAVLLYETENARSLAAVIDALFLNESRRHAMACAAWRLAQDRFNWDEEKKTLLGLIEEALSGNALPKTAMASIREHLLK